MTAIEDLSDAQRRGIDEYQTLRRETPRLFEHRVHRPLILDADEMASFARKNDVVLGVVLKTPYFWVLNDLVKGRGESGKSADYTYLRIVSNATRLGGANVVVLATIRSHDLGQPGAVILVRQERHALGELALELPRGFAKPGVDGLTIARDELKEETGFVAATGRRLGTTTTDSGLTDSKVEYYHLEVDHREAPTPEPEEAITEVLVVPQEQLWADLAEGKIRDGFTLQAWALYMASLRRTSKP